VNTRSQHQSLILVIAQAGSRIGAGKPLANQSDGATQVVIQAAVEEMPIPEGSPASAKELKAKSVTKLRNGGIVFELGNAAAARAINDERRGHVFSQKFGAGAAIKPRTFEVCVKNVPVGFEPIPEVLRAIESSNNLPEGIIYATKWIKEPERRERGQQTAHLSMKLRDAEIANEIIREGIVIINTRRTAERRTRDWLRCMKCQERGHLARDCNRPTVCARCARDHDSIRDKCHTPESDMRCINCIRTGRPDRHPAWDRNCPTRLHWLESESKRRPEDYSQYFMTTRNIEEIMPRPTREITINHVTGLTQRARKNARRERARSRSRSIASVESLNALSIDPSLTASPEPDHES
jgi:hypothetical protein